MNSKLRVLMAGPSLDMQGGVAKAMDYAACAYILPHMRANQVPAAQMKPLLTGLPQAQAMLER